MDNDVPFSTTDPYTFAHRQSATFHSSHKVLNEILVDDDITTVYLWGYNYKYPVAKIQNSTYADVISAMSVTYDALQTKTETELTTIFNSLRTALPNAMITSFTYNPLFGKSTETDINGKTTYFEYDPQGRLKATKDQDGKIMNEYEYHYKN
ncbi:MAG: hypothetical protein ACOYOV_17230 [Bacteroidales bacterium]